MRYFPLRIRFVLAVIVLGGLSSSWSRQSAAQTPVQGPIDDLSHLKRQEIHPKTVGSPFPLNVRTKVQQALEFRSPEQMTAADRELAENNQAEIARRAGLQGF